MKKDGRIFSKQKTDYLFMDKEGHAVNTRQKTDMKKKDGIRGKQKQENL